MRGRSFSTIAVFGILIVCLLGLSASAASARYDERDDYAQVQPIIDQINAYVIVHPSFTLKDEVRERGGSDDGETVTAYFNFASRLGILDSKCWYSYKGNRRSCSYKQQIANGVSSYTVAKRSKKTGKVSKCWKSRKASNAFSDQLIDLDSDETYFGLNRQLMTRELGPAGVIKLYVEDSKREFRVYQVEYDPVTFALKGWTQSEFYLTRRSVKSDPRIDFYRGQYFGYIRRTTKRTITQWDAPQPRLSNTKPKC